MFRRKLMGLTLALMLAGTGAVAYAQAAKIPTTPEEHFALAKKYQDQANAARKQAAEHRAMAEAARNSTANAHSKHGQNDPRVAKMEKHCAALTTAADKLAEENQKAADFHSLRGKELQGK